MQEIAIAVIGLLGIIITAGVGYRRAEIDKQKLVQAGAELRFQRAALSFPEFVNEWAEINKELTAMMEETELDRFLLLRAWNGSLSPLWTTAVFQMRTSEQAPISYVHFELDEDYQKRVRDIVQGGPILLHTSELPDGVIKKVYEAEGVTSSFWAHIDTFETPDRTGKALAYTSFSTHDPDGLTDKTITRCRILVGRLKGLSLSFDHTRDVSDLRPL